MRVTSVYFHEVMMNLWDFNSCFLQKLDDFYLVCNFDDFFELEILLSGLPGDKWSYN